VTDRGVITGISVSHRRASVGDIEAACGESQRRAVESLLSIPPVEEAFVLQTCNRAEAYVVTAEEGAGRGALSTYVGDVPEDTVVTLNHEASLRHLLRVAAGLESLVLGEDQILGQVRDAYEDARGVGGIGPMLEDGITKAIHVGERARTETAINEGTVSIGSAAVELARRERDLADVTALVVGAGEMGSLTAGALADVVDELIVANRTIPHAEHVAETVDVPAEAVPLSALDGSVETADVVVSATGSAEPVLDPDALAAAGETLVVDLGQPRDVAPAVEELPNVTVHDLDALESVTAETRQQRAAAAETVEAIVDDEFERLLTQYKRKRADRVIAAMYESAEHVKNRELATALSKLDDDLTDDQRAVVEAMADSLVNQLLAPPTRSLRDAAEDDDWSTINTALELFDPDFGTDDDSSPAFVEGLSPEDIPPGMAEQLPPAVRDRLDD